METLEGQKLPELFKVSQNLDNKRSVLRRQSRDTKSKYKKVGVLPIRIVKSNVSSVGPSSEKKI